jgi:ribosomal protein S18 acetylase RimI-like enzyme
MSRKIELPDLSLYEVQRKDYDKAEQLITESFVDDPGVLFLLNSNKYDPEIARHLHRFNLEYAGRYGKILASSENLEAISIWIHSSVRKTIIKEIMCGGISVARKTYKDFLKINKKYIDFSNMLHHKSINTPHWYLMSLNVDKNQQGKHFSSKVMQPFLDYCDKTGQACYLETHKEKNVHIYEHFGFNVAEKADMPGTSTPQWAMVRKPGEIVRN